jgi:hypothetical protein
VTVSPPQKRADQFYERLADWIAEKIGVVVSTQPRQYDDVSLKGPCWQTSATAMDHFQVSRPTLKAMRERGEVEFIKLYTYNSEVSRDVFDHRGGFSVLCVQD